MISYRTAEVFVPGGLPSFTYNPREEHRLEESLNRVNDNLCKLVIVTGPTKSGKTVLVKKIFPKEKSVWFDGGSFSSEEEFWLEIISQLDGFLDVSESTGSVSTRNKTAKGKAELTMLIPFPGIPKASGEVSYQSNKQKQRTRTVNRKGNAKTTAIKLLEENKIALIIDDFHYIKRESQSHIVRAVKSLIFEGIPVIFIAIPHRRFDAVKVEREMTGRIENIAIPLWKPKELEKIAATGFPLLNVMVDYEIISKLIDESISSPHLMQEFCKELCFSNGIEKTNLLESTSINNSIMLKSLFENVAEKVGKTMFDKLSRGPRQRSDRIKRRTIDGENPDIYGLVLKALANLRPNMDKVDYEELRRVIRDISVDQIPAAHEVSRVLDYMSNIAASDEASTPVLDWEKNERILHITDPYFAYYLRWGGEVK